MPLAATELGSHYQAYLDCLNRQAWTALGRYVDDAVEHNGRPLGLAGYQAMLEGDHAAIPDLHFTVHLLVVEAPWLAAQLDFDCTPRGELFGLAVNGRRVRFSEHVFYRFENGRIREVRSVIDTAAIAAQLADG
ncbi:putative ester cyclase [Pseudomonas sp. SORGH_AS199]|jgi:predicted ester cyclase|uniref:Ester cyclase n=1 Tax=Pseudomonas flavocrustae TaxID=2991719 RepID=A0ABT6IDU8_9PSED|nr:MULTISPECIES: ester cyclase [Pseudomonas]MDH4762662.1 ester cyclase [Pseudomonas sp. CBMAI 2609]MDK8266037.1 ester cyclase [Pseudomonas oryzihabitans]MDR6230045.1 putative ester cyclase [Pseudomonas sp. SORGH_AS_0199]QNQ99158.1 ester cyclase [Pseudomonas psychrotolerans]